MIADRRSPGCSRTVSGRPISWLLTIVSLVLVGCTEREIRILQEEAFADREAGRVEEAIQHYREILTLNPADLDVRNELGFLHASEGRPDSALSHYALAIATDSTIAEPYYNSGVLFVGIGMFDSARASYEKAIYHDPNHVQALSNLGSLLEREGRVEEALEHYALALSIDSTFIPAWLNTGRIRFLNGQIWEAESAYRQALTLNANLPDAHAALATIYRQSDDLDRAIQHLEHAIRIAPDSPARDSLPEFLILRDERDKRRDAGEMRARHIVVHQEGFALMLLKRVRSGEDFASLARELSIDPSGRSGGDLGAFQPGDLLHAFESTVKRIEPGAFGGPIKTPLGWHIIQRIY